MKKLRVLTEARKEFADALESRAVHDFGVADAQLAEAPLQGPDARVRKLGGESQVRVAIR
jgi:hypothetical protein